MVKLQEEIGQTRILYTVCWSEVFFINLFKTDMFIPHFGKKMFYERITKQTMLSQIQLDNCHVIINIFIHYIKNSLYDTIYFKSYNS
jgi:hypothetical protein